MAWREQVNFQWDDDGVHFVLDQHAELDIYSASSLKQQFANRHVAPLGHFIPIPSQSVFAFSPYCCVLNGDATNTNFIVFGLTRLRLEPTIICTWEYANHYTTNAVHFRRRKDLDANIYFRVWQTEVLNAATPTVYLHCNRTSSIFLISTWRMFQVRSVWFFSTSKLSGALTKYYSLK